jgi:hypothetical protein
MVQWWFGRKKNTTSPAHLNDHCKGRKSTWQKKRRRQQSRQSTRQLTWAQQHSDHQPNQKVSLPATAADRGGGASRAAAETEAPEVTAAAAVAEHQLW